MTLGGRTGAAGAAVANLGLGLALALAGGCASTAADPRYRPAQSVLEVVAVLRRHVPDDTYRFEPARDFTGRNVYRSSLLRLENLEQLHRDSLRAGHMDDVLAFAKGRALERLRAFELAARSYRRAAEHEGPLQAEAERSAALCQSLSEAVAEPAPGTEPGAGAADAQASVHAADRLHQERTTRLGELLAANEADHYAAVIREQIEHADLEHALVLVSARRLAPDGDVRALAAVQRLVLDHRESKNQNRHLLRLAELYEELARDYVAQHPPESLRFDPPAFEELVVPTTRLYEAVANQDGATERIEAKQRLESFLAFTLRVDHDRFSR